MTGRHPRADVDISVVIPVYNDPEGIATTLSCLVDQNVAEDRYEIIPVDNRSTDQTFAVLHKYASDYPALVFPEKEYDTQGSYAARNAGVRAASGDVIAFLDADMEVDGDYIGKIAERMNDGETDYLGCNVELFVPEGEESWIARYDLRTAFPIETYITEQSFCPTCGLVVRREIFADVGGFDDRFTSAGDGEFGNRVAEAGYDLAYEPNITVRHPVRSDLESLLKKEIRVGYGLCQKQEFYSERYGKPGKPPKPTGAKSPNEEHNQETETEGDTPIWMDAMSYIAVLTRAMGYGLGVIEATKKRVVS